MKLLKAILFTCTIVGCTASTPKVETVRSPTQASTNWNALLDDGMPKDLKFGVALGGIDPFTRNADDMMALASTAKLFTSGAALARLGEDYRFPTTLRWRQTKSGAATDLRIIGSGDPTWGMKEFAYEINWHVEAMAQALFDQGVRELDKEIKFESDSRWEQINFPAGWKDSDPTNCDGAIGQAFNMSANCASFTVRGTREGSWDLPGLYLPVVLKINKGKTTDLNVKMVRPTPQTYDFVIEGTWAPGAQPQTLFLPIHDARPWIDALFRQALQKVGITIHAVASVEGDNKELVFYSPKLSLILQPFNKNSINFIGDDLLKAVGAADAGSTADLRQAGLKYLRDFLATAGIANGYILNDGSGLSRTTQASARLMFAYLTYLQSRPFFLSMLNALPIAGIDGTLKARMTGPPAQGALRGKTGTLDGVYNLAGYVPHGKDFMPFVMLTKTAPERGQTVRVALDRVGTRLTTVNAAFGDALWTTIGNEQRRTFPFVEEHSGENYP